MSKALEKKKVSALDALPPRRRAFVLEYVKDFNGTQAAIRAGYKAKTANPAAARLLAIVSVKKAVDSLVDEFTANKKTELRKTIIETLERITSTTEHDRDRIKAVELLGKYSGLWRDEVNVQANLQINFEKSENTDKGF